MFLYFTKKSPAICPEMFTESVKSWKLDLVDSRIFYTTR